MIYLIHHIFHEPWLWVFRGKANLFPNDTVHGIGSWVYVDTRDANADST